MSQASLAAVEAHLLVWCTFRPDVVTDSGATWSPLDSIPSGDAETLYLRCGSPLAFAYLFHVTDACFGDVKPYIGGRG